MLQKCHQFSYLIKTNELNFALLLVTVIVSPIANPKNHEDIMKSLAQLARKFSSSSFKTLFLQNVSAPIKGGIMYSILLCAGGHATATIRI